MSNDVSAIIKAIQQADEGRTLTALLNEKRGLLLLCPDKDEHFLNKILSYLDALVDQYGRVVIVLDEEFSYMTLEAGEEVRFVTVNDRDMEKMLKYALCAAYIDTSVRIVSLTQEIGGETESLANDDRIDEDMLIKRGLLGIVGV